MFAYCIYVHFDKNVANYIGTLNYKQYYDATSICATGACVAMTASCAAYLGTYFSHLPTLLLVSNESKKILNKKKINRNIMGKYVYF